MLQTCHKFKSQEFHNRFVFLISALNASLYIAHDKVPGEIPVREHQESTSKPQLQVKKQRTSGEEKLTGKYNNYR